ncbi:MGMT family protein [Dyadobacter fanqingshengii]|uniref:MGMT family protein n=1 Tax=Dyadobacter fanqingshengii TaxID=2906443 RepID=A0A9X1TIS9_9BACT|nr:MGMT family protein [Dyadobacter fanqingshengii]MCF0043192.1 MGMT family protein [Dyadobacter fanqingshengii]MCF0043270.1 MGMT family protein [Dyadobacter fanqingshengii]USJ35743.1 MGMT family protein [Dyadobacter fanqingshengii]
MKQENDFFTDVYDVVRQIPKGRATSYGAIAAYLGAKRGARMVGWAMGNSFTQYELPAHRVVNKQGELSARHLFETPTTMQERLESEGVVVKDDRIQNWNECFWDPEKELN